MILPNLLIVGAAKSGTTSLHNYLDQHPDIFMSKHKEPHFLINNEIGNSRIPNGISDINEYSNLFVAGSNAKYRGESSAMYLQFPDIVIENIKRNLANDVKIIIMLRNPIDRAFSGYHHVKRYNIDENLSFEDAIEKSEKRYFKNTNITPASRYIHIGMYFDFVNKFFAHFGNKVHIIIYDDFIENTKNELDKIFNFLDVKKSKIDTEKQYMTGGWKWKNSFQRKIFMKQNVLKRVLKIILPNKYFRLKIRNLFLRFFTKPTEKMNDDTRIKLKNIYKKDVSKLSDLLNRDLNYWMK